MRRALLALGLFLAGIAVAAGLDARGWHSGTPAARAAQVLGSPFEERVVVPLPKTMAKRVRKPTLLVYVSPTCPHCRHVAPEVATLAERLGKRAQVIGVATGRSDPDAIEAFRSTFGWTFDMVHDTDGEIGAAMGASGTPSALLVRREGSEVVAVDAWYPFAPGSSTLVDMRLRDDPWSAFEAGEHQGARVCGACHVQELEAWYLTHHAVAWRTLVEDERQDDPKCNVCHVTGAGTPGGWAPGGEHDHLVDVGCEACHGPGGPHDGVRTDARSTCVGCHDAEHSIAFTVEKGLPLIDHFRTVDMDEQAFAEARRALVSGEAPRELLAFSDGEYVGAQACASCHEAAHGQWTGSAHAGAMAKLVAQGSHEEPSCVACHATAQRSGPRPTELSGYRVEEGVGCEACHGPGGAHVAAGGGTDNIVGLGESCPVCVIEAVCTSCHTTAWDPDWDLERDLARVRHTPASEAATEP